MVEQDVIIIGGGPAGAAAAYDLAAAGMRVLILDRRSFRRPKPCGGALTVKTLKRLRFSIAPLIRYVARDLEVSLEQGRRRVFRSTHPIAAMTLRSELDHFCLRKAIERGARFERIDDVALIAEEQDGVRLETCDGRRLAARFLIGADGANSRTRKLIGAAPTPRALALEGHVPAPGAGSAALMHFDFGAVPGGYGWSFPKGDHCNVGLYTQRPGVTFTKADLLAYARRAFGAERVDDIVGYPLGTGGEDFDQAWQRVFLVGDAAGGAERLLGEGIHNAIKSGQAAAQAIIASRRDGIAASARFRRNMTEIRKDLNAYARAARCFYGAPRLAYGALGLHLARTTLMRGFAAGKTFREILHTPLLSPFYAIEPVPAIVEHERDAARAGAACSPPHLA